MQSSFRKWMLPEGVVEALPDDAMKLNALEQTAFNTFSRWGYQPLRPPMMEYADTFVGDDRNDNLVAQTIQFKDQKSGKQLGFRADITPQITRIDAHYLKTDKVARYAYAGEVVRSYPTGHGSARNPTVIGAELLGSSSSQADVEIVSLLISFFNAIKLPRFIIELGNVDIIIELLTAIGVDESQFGLFFEAFATKDTERLGILAERNKVSDQFEILAFLTTLYGDSGVIDEAKKQFIDYPSVLSEIEQLEKITKLLQNRYPDVEFHIDLSDVYGYRYHNGLIFSAYVEGVWQPVARGGRYDRYGNQFDEHQNERSSIGFSCYLNLITPLIDKVVAANRIIACQLENDLALEQFIADLREQGDIVISIFDDDISSNQKCSHKIIKTADGYSVVEN